MPNGYDFSDDEDILNEQSKGYEMDWSTLDEKSIASALGSVNSKVTACALAISRVFTDNDCIKVRDSLRALGMEELGSQGWILTFYETNKDVFKRAEGKDRPDFYKELSAENKEKFEKVLLYFHDIAHLLPIRDKLRRMIIYQFSLEDGFRIDRVASILDQAGYNVDFYRRINKDVELIASILNISWDKLEQVASQSNQFLESNRGKLTTSELEKGYREARLADYRKFLSGSLSSSFLVQRSGGLAYSIDPRRLAAMRVIDRYTKEITEMSDLDDRLQKEIDDCKKMITQDIAEAEKNCATQAAQFICAAFHTLVEEMSSFCEWCLEVFRAFKDKREDGCYCWMKKLSALSSVNPKYDFNPSTAEPWDGGTHYFELFTDAAKALGTQARTFAYEHGTL